MKKLNILAGLMMLLVMMFTACDDDLSKNPTLQSPSTFKLNTPSYAATNVNLATSDSLSFTWSQPDYGFPLASEYQVEISTANKWTTSVDEASADNTGNTIADYATVGETSNICKQNVGAGNFAKALEQLNKWTSDAVPATQTVYARVKSTVKGSSVYSNIVTLTVIPYYVELKDAAPVIYYLIGGCIGDGKWSNVDASNIGGSIIPMHAIAGETYDKKTGYGKIEYTGYFPAGGEFKILKTIGDWNYGFCKGEWKDDTYVPTYRSGGDDPGNIKIDDAGYYDIIVNTADNSCTIKKYTKDVSKYTSIAIAGTENSWSATANVMKAISTFDGAENHDWVETLTYKADAPSDGGCKFTADGAWTDNWGDSAFPYGTGSAGGHNILYKAGTYKVIFNDITHQYIFIAQ